MNAKLEAERFPSLRRAYAFPTMKIRITSANKKFAVFSNGTTQSATFLSAIVST